MDKNKNLAGVTWQENKEICRKLRLTVLHQTRDPTASWIQLSDQQPVPREEESLWW